MYWLLLRCGLLSSLGGFANFASNMLKNIRTIVQFSFNIVAPLVSLAFGHNITAFTFILLIWKMTVPGRCDQIICVCGRGEGKKETESHWCVKDLNFFAAMFDPQMLKKKESILIIFPSRICFLYTNIFSPTDYKKH